MKKSKFSEATFYIWKKKYAHLGVSELRQVWSLEDENGRLQRLRGLVARQAHPHRGAPKDSLRPTQRRCVRACHLARFSRAA